MSHPPQMITILISYSARSRYVQGDHLSFCRRRAWYRIAAHRSNADANRRKLLSGFQVIFSSMECTRRMARLMFSNRATVFDQAPIVLLAAECAAHWHLASAKHDEIAGLSVELGFQVAARGRTRELDAGLDAHRGTPLSTLACRCVTSASLSVEKQTRSGKAPDCVCAPSLLSVVQPRRRSHHGSCARPATHAAPPLR